MTAGPHRSGGGPFAAHRRLFAVSAVMLFLAATVLVVVVNAPAHAAPATTKSATAELTRSVSLTPALSAEVAAHVNAEAASSSPTVAAAARSLGPSLERMTPDQILSMAGVGNLAPMVNTALTVADTFTPAYNFGSWTGYLTAAGEGCLTGGVSALLGAAATSAASYETVSVAGAVAGGGAGAGEIATKTNPIVFGVTCAIGAAAGLIIYQQGLSQAQTINYAGLWAAFAQNQFTAFYNYVNLTTAMYASLASLLVFAQVAFDRMADNAALLQIGNPQFNTAQDLLQSGLAQELGSMMSDFNYQLGNDYENIPMWLDALTSSGAGFDGYGVISQASATNIAPATNIVPNATGSVSNATAAGLVLSVSTTNVLFATFSSTQLYVLCPAGSCSFHAYSPTKNHAPQTWWNVTGASYFSPLSTGLNPGLYNVTVPSGGTVLVPFATVLPNASSKTVGSFGWQERYRVLPGAVIEATHSVSDCIQTPVTGPSWTLGSLYGYWGDTVVGGVSYNSYILNVDGHCGADGNTLTVTGSPIISSFRATVPGGPTYVTASALPITLGNVELNATLSGQTYWAFIRSLGYTTLQALPGNCVIPAPWQELPSAINLGALSLNESIGLYEGWLKSMGTFYGANGTFQVCVTGKLVQGWNWNNETFSFQPGYAEYGGLYLNNGTGSANVNGKALPSEHLATGSTWALPYTVAHAAANGSGPFLAAYVNGSSTSSKLVGTPTGVNVTVGETIVVQADGIAGTWTVMNDTLGNVFANVTSDNSDGTVFDYTWACNRTTHAGSDTFSAHVAAIASAGAVNIEAYVFSSAGGVGVGIAHGHTGSATLLRFSWAAPPAGTQVLVFGNGWSTTNFSVPGGFTHGPNVMVTGNLHSSSFVYPTLSSMAVGIGAGSEDATVVTVLGTGSVLASKGANTTMIIVPTLKSVVIPQGSNWPVPAANPLYIFYLQKNASQAQQNCGNGACNGNYTVVNLVLAFGNGTRNDTASAYGSHTPGDVVFLTACEQNFVYLGSGVPCSIAVTNWTIYVTNILCGGACQNVVVTTGAQPSTCGGGIFLLGNIADAVNGYISGIPIIGAIGCAVGWLVAIIVGVVIALVVILAVVYVVRAVRDR